MRAIAERYWQKSTGDVVALGDLVRIHGETVGEVVDFQREHPNVHGHAGQMLAIIRWGRPEGLQPVSAWRVESCTVVEAGSLAYSTAGPGLPGGLAYVHDAAVIAVRADGVTPRNPSVSGYGGKIPTRYRVKLADNRWRRVYTMVYGNGASPYLRIAGRTVHLGVALADQLEHL